MRLRQLRRDDDHDPLRAGVQLDVGRGGIEPIQQRLGTAGVRRRQHLGACVGEQVADPDAVLVVAGAAAIERRRDRHDELGLHLQQPSDDVTHHRPTRPSAAASRPTATRFCVEVASIGGAGSEPRATTTT